MKTIKNEYDGPLPPAKKLKGDASVSLDYVNSDNAAEINAGIRDTIKGVRLSILAIGIGLAKLKAKELFLDLNFDSMNEYLENLCEEMQIERSTAHNWLYIGEAFVKYRRDLERVEFTEADGPTKLPYVGRALEVHEKREVFKNVKDLSLRAFKEYAAGKKAPGKPSVIRVVGNSLFIGKKQAVTFSDALDPKTLSYLTKINVQAGEALEAGEVLFVTRLYDSEELKRFERGADRLKKEMRVGYKPKKRKN
ncbi:MAG: hypothetical protein FWB95_02435 [Treponema sp.]|nr:hypothetical protein [Treponema sp.]